MPFPRHRRVFAIGLAVTTIALGLALQQLRAALPAPLSDPLGDALWAAMIFWLVTALFPFAPRLKRAIPALGICWLVEFSQLYHGSWLDAWRASRIGHLVLGTDFDWHDLIAYGLGVSAAWLLDGSIRERS